MTTADYLFSIDHILAPTAHSIGAVNQPTACEQIISLIAYAAIATFTVAMGIVAGGMLGTIAGVALGAGATISTFTFYLYTATSKSNQTQLSIQLSKTPPPTDKFLGIGKGAQWADNNCCFCSVVHALFANIRHYDYLLEEKPLDNPLQKALRNVLKESAAGLRSDLQFIPSNTILRLRNLLLRTNEYQDPNEVIRQIFSTLENITPLLEETPIDPIRVMLEHLFNSTNFSELKDKVTDPEGVVFYNELCKTRSGESHKNFAISMISETVAQHTPSGIAQAIADLLKIELSDLFKLIPPATTLADTLTELGSRVSGLNGFILSIDDRSSAHMMTEMFNSDLSIDGRNFKLMAMIMLEDGNHITDLVLHKGNWVRHNSSGHRQYTSLFKQSAFPNRTLMDQEMLRTYRGRVRNLVFCASEDCKSSPL